MRSFFNVGFVCIIDFFDIDGDFRSFEFLIEFGIKINFVEYNGLKKSILKWIGECNIKEIKLIVGLYILNILVIFYKNRKGCKDMYNILIREKRV